MQRSLARFKGSLNRRQILDKVEGATVLGMLLITLSPRFYPAVCGNVSAGPCATLDGMKSEKHEAYEKCSIYGLSYDLASTTNRELIENDYKEILRLYCAMVDSPVVPSVEDLPWAEVSSKSADETILNNKSAKFVHLQVLFQKHLKVQGNKKPE